MPPQWHYTTIVEFLDHWQSLLAGLIALLAAIIALTVTIRIERRKANVELKALRSSLALELRIIIARAYGAHDLFKELARQTTPITARQAESFSHMPTPLVYQATAGKIGLLGESAMDVVSFYGVIEVLCAKANELQRCRTPDDISAQVIAGLGDGFLTACKTGIPILSKLKTGVRIHDGRDAELIQLIEAALSARV